jgi:tripartite-type tricarboxylate transporter receptor subunit TctC
MSFRNNAALIALLGIAFLTPLVSDSNAAGFPEKPMRLVVPFPPAGAADIMARIVTQKLAENLRQPIVVENRTGAGTVIGTEVFVKSSPDGYTLFLHTPPTAINATLLKKLPYDTRRDIVPVVTLGQVPLIILVNASIPANTVQELAAFSKRKAGGLTYASGNGAVAKVYRHEPDARALSGLGACGDGNPRRTCRFHDHVFLPEAAD